MLKRLGVCLTLAVVCVLAAAPTAKADHVFLALIDGFQEVPPTGSPANGFGVYVLNNAATRLDWSIQYNGLIGGNVVGAHFHRAAFGANGGVVRGYPAANFPSPTGAVQDVWLSTDAQPLTLQLVIDMFTFDVYFNIHTTRFGGGEVRGQLFWWFSY